jgi:hypothetical protein
MSEHFGRLTYSMPSDRVSGLVVVAAFSGGGSGDFTFLHILDVTAAHGFNFDGKIYERINLSSRGQWVTEKQWRSTPA